MKMNYRILHLIFLTATVLPMNGLVAQNAPRSLKVAIEAASNSDGESMTIPMALKITNQSDAVMSIFFNPDILLGVDIVPRDTTNSSVREQPDYASVEEEQIRIKPSETYIVKFDLDKYLDFKTPGQYKIDYIVNLSYFEGTIFDGARLKTIKSSGWFVISR